MPNNTEILIRLGKTKYFSCIDLAARFHQIPLHPKNQEKTGFSTDQGHFEFQRICFLFEGWTSIPASNEQSVNRYQGHKIFCQFRQRYNYWYFP